MCSTDWLKVTCHIQSVENCFLKNKIKNEHLIGEPVLLCVKYTQRELYKFNYSLSDWILSGFYLCLLLDLYNIVLVLLLRIVNLVRLLAASVLLLHCMVALAGQKWVALIGQKLQRWKKGKNKEPAVCTLLNMLPVIRFWKQLAALITLHSSGGKKLPSLFISLYLCRKKN